MMLLVPVELLAHALIVCHRVTSRNLHYTPRDQESCKMCGDEGCCDSQRLFTLEEPARHPGRVSAGLEGQGSKQDKQLRNS